MHEFPVIDSAASVEQLRLRLKANELEQYGEAFTPEFVYEVIRRLPRFSSMRVSKLSYYTPNLLTLYSEVTNKMPRSSWDFFWKNCMMNALEL